MESNTLKGAYRIDLDGLRFLAILMVFIFHIDEKYFKNGFLGVDIFLVLSGYLIANVINNSNKSKSKTIANFYYKRVRRLSPSLFVMILFSMFFGWMTLSNIYLIDLVKQSFSSIFAVSNVYFNYTSGYFDIDSKLRPLLNVWSLSLEEQYYLVFPLLFLFIRKYVLVFLPISLVLYVLWFGTDEAFYLLPFRVWEFLVGVCLIYIKDAPLSKYSTLGSILFLAGSIWAQGPLANIFAALFAVTYIVYPRSELNILLSSKIFRYIGILSYSSFGVHFS